MTQDVETKRAHEELKALPQGRRRKALREIAWGDLAGGALLMVNAGLIAYGGFHGFANNENPIISAAVAAGMVDVPLAVILTPSFLLGKFKKSRRLR